MRIVNAFRFFLRIFLLAAVLPVIFAVISLSALGQTRYVVTNDDAVFPFPNGVSFFAESANGTLKLKGQVDTGNYGIGGGFFGANRVIAASDGTQPCVYMSQAFGGTITGVAVNDLTVGGTASGSFTDTGMTNGIGLAAQGGYLYASFTDDSTIATFSIQTGCSLMFLNDTPVVGLTGGVINAMATNGSLMVVSYTDGSIESFNIANGTPVSNEDEQLSTGTVKSQNATYSNQVVITPDGQFAIFGDTSTSVVLEVSNISAGKLSPTLVYASAKSISSSNILLSPDETVLYTIDTQGASVTAFAFNKTSGTLTYGCTSPAIRGQSENWSYLANAALVRSTANGGGVYVAEFGTTSGIALVNYTASNGTCSLQENTASPFVDPNSTALLSIATATTTQ
jgi:6-phosphogluconolactonase (cycloisomerase 2 family)